MVGLYSDIKLSNMMVMADSSQMRISGRLMDSLSNRIYLFTQLSVLSLTNFTIGFIDIVKSLTNTELNLHAAMYKNILHTHTHTSTHKPIYISSKIMLVTRTVDYDPKPSNAEVSKEMWD